MKIVKEIIFRCEFCNKPMFNKGAMILHERMCKKNPKNRHECFKYCRHLEKKSEQIEDEDGDVIGGGYSLYSYKLERFKANKKRMINKERMPLKCKDYEIEDGHDKDWDK